MPDTSSTAQPAAQPKFRCRHILADGHRCLTPCLRGEEFCYFHHTTRRPVANPVQRRSRRSSFELPNPEDRASIQIAIGEVLRRIAANDIDLRRAGLLLYGLQTASSNLPKDNKDKPGSASANDRESDTYAGNAPNTVEDVVLHPTLGLLAPRTQYSQQPPKGFIGLLLEDLDREELERQELERNNPTSHQEDANPIPTLQATATSTLQPDTPSRDSENLSKTSKHRHLDRSRVVLSHGVVERSPYSAFAVACFPP